MASKDLLSQQQIVELEANIASPRKTPEFPYLRMLTGTLSPEQEEKRRTLGRAAYQHLDAIMIDWPYPWIHQDRTPERVKATLLNSGGYGIYRSTYGTEWMKVDQPKPGQIAELQVRSYHHTYLEPESGPGSGGYRERCQPHMAMWLRAKDLASGAVSSPEEVFGFPEMKMGGGAPNNPNVRFRGDCLRPDAAEWENLNVLLNLLEAHMGLAPNNPHTQPNAVS